MLWSHTNERSFVIGIRGNSLLLTISCNFRGTVSINHKWSHSAFSSRTTLQWLHVDGPESPYFRHWYLCSVKYITLLVVLYQCTLALKSHTKIQEGACKLESENIKFWNSDRLTWLVWTAANANIIIMITIVPQWPTSTLHFHLPQTWQYFFMTEDNDTTISS